MIDLNSTITFVSENIEKVKDMGQLENKIVAITILLLALFLLFSAILGKIFGNLSSAIKFGAAIATLEFGLFLYIKSLFIASSIDVQGIFRFNPFFYYNKALLALLAQPGITKEKAFELGFPIVLATILLILMVLSFLSSFLKRKGVKKYIPPALAVFVMAAFYGGRGLWLFLGIFKIAGISLNLLIFILITGYTAVIFYRGVKK